jgi:hypothetical protein
MSDTFEQQLHAAFAERIDGVSPAIGEHLRSIDYHPRPARRRALPVVGALVATLTTAVIAAVLLLSTGTPAAFAGWTAVPSPPTAAALAAAQAACGNVPSTDMLAAEARGPYTALTFNRDDKRWQCIAKGSRLVLNVSTRYPTRAYASAPAGKVMLPVITQQAFGRTTVRLRKLNNRYQEVASDGNDRSTVKHENSLLAAIAAARSGPGTLSVAVGIAGPGVSGVTFVLADGDRIDATVNNGWYVAWWPGAGKPGGATAARIAVSTVSGTRSSGVPAPVKVDVGYRVPAPGCVPGDRCSVLVPLEVAPVVPRAVLAHYSMFRDTAPVKQSSQPAIVRMLVDRFADSGRFRGDRGVETLQMQNGMSLGLDATQVRRLYVGNHVTLWIIPGSEGFCQARVQKGGGGGASCGPGSSFLRRGAITNAGTSIAHHAIKFFLGGFIPNGNPTITVHLNGGQTRKVTVKHNAFRASFNSQPHSLTFKDAAGKVVTEPAPTPNEV